MKQFKKQIEVRGKQNSPTQQTGASLEDPNMAEEMKLRAERTAMYEEDTGYTNKETGKPYKRKELTLPPLNPEGQKFLIKKNKGISPAIRRLARLPFYAASVITDIKEKCPPTEERRRLLFAFTVECQEAMHAVTEFVDRCQNNDPQTRNDLVRKYSIWEHKLLQAFEQQ